MPEDKETNTEIPTDISPAKPFTESFNISRFILPIFIVVVILGSATGYLLANKPGVAPGKGLIEIQQTPKAAEQDTRTFRDFSEGIIRPKPQEKSNGIYSEGTHYLEREGGTPVALTSSVVDLSLYEGKKVKVFGETQKALKAGWLMDVGRVDQIQ